MCHFKAYKVYLLISVLILIALAANAQHHYTLRLVGAYDNGQVKMLTDFVRDNFSQQTIRAKWDEPEKELNLMSPVELQILPVLKQLAEQGHFIALTSPYFVGGVLTKHPYLLNEVRRRWAYHRGITATNVLVVTEEEWVRLPQMRRDSLEFQHVVVFE
ncbi:MAG: hypothetical protein RL226_783 [Bacteroidota bacterium]|jgi:hypothetical protein